MKRRTFATTVVSGIAISALAGCSGEETSDSATGGDENGNSGGDSQTSGNDATDTAEPTEEPTATDEPEQPDVKILDHEMEYDDMMGAKVVGTVKNTTDSELSYMQVQARFFDDSDTRIGEGMWNATDVSAGTEVQFETVPAQVDNEPANYEVETGTSPT